MAGFDAEFFKSLGEAKHSDRRSLLRAQRKAREGPSTSDMLKQALIGAVAEPIIGTVKETVQSAIQAPFQRNFEAFENEVEGVTKLKRTFKNSQNTRNYFDTTQEEISLFDGTSDEYWRNKTIEGARGRTLEAITRQGNLSPESFSNFANQRAVSFADQLVEDSEGNKISRWRLRKKTYDNAYAESGDIGTSDDLDRMLRAANKRPENAVDALFSKMGRVFSGKTKEEIDMEAFETIKGSQLYKENEEFRIAFNSYKKARNYEGLEDFIEDYKDHQNPKPRIVKEDTQVVSTGTTGEFRAFKTIETTEKNPNTGLTETKKTIEVLGNNFNFSTDAGRLKVLSSTLNLAQYTYKVLNADGFRELSSTLNKAGINLADPKTEEEYHTIAKIYQKLATDDKNLKDPARDKELLMHNTAILNSVLESPSFQAFGAEEVQKLMDIINNPKALQEEKQRATTDYLDSIKIIIDMLSQVKSPSSVPTFSGEF